MKKNIVKMSFMLVVIGAVVISVYLYYVRHSLENQIEMFKVNNEAAQKRAVAYMVRAGKKAVPYLIAALEKEDTAVRMNATEALGRIDDPAVVEPLVSMLVDPDPNIQYAAMNALENRGTMALEKLIETARGDDQKLRAHSIELLGRIGDPSARAVAEQGLKDSSPEVRAQAVIALRWIAFEEAVELIFPLLNDTDNNVRMMVVFALGDMPESSPARRALVKSLNSADDQVREKAAHFLGRSGYPDVEEALCGILSDRELKVRWTAAEALGKVGGERALGALSNVLLKRNEVEFVKSSAKKAIENIKERLKKN